MSAVAAGTVTQVTVTAEDIANGRPCEPCLCPLAIAIERATGRAVNVETDEVGIIGTPLAACLPDAAQAFIARFDGVLPVEPFEFEIEWEDA